MKPSDPYLSYLRLTLHYIWPRCGPHRPAKWPSYWDHCLSRTSAGRPMRLSGDLRVIDMGYVKKTQQTARPRIEDVKGGLSFPYCGAIFHVAIDRVTPKLAFQPRRI